jgi:hypothetical protein
MRAGCPVLVSRETGLDEVVGPAFPEFLFDVHTGPEGLAEAIRALMAILPSKPRLPVQVRQRAKQILREAEEGWAVFLEECNKKGHAHGPDDLPRDFFANLLQILTSMVGPFPDAPAAHLQVYFKKDGNYSEDHSLRVSYPVSRWITLCLTLPEGTGESPLRVDPADETGLIHVDSISLVRDGVEIWHCGGPDAFCCLAVHGDVDRSMLGRSLALSAKTCDPQILIDCPVTDAPIVLKIRLCFSPQS